MCNYGLLVDIAPPVTPIIYTRKTLELNPSPLTPWLTVALAQDEIAILYAREEECFVDEHGGEVVRG